MISSNGLSAKVIPVALGLGCIGLIAIGIGAIFDPPHALQSYLVAFVYWTGLSLGALGILLLQYVTGGEWGLVIRRIMEAASLNLAIMAFFAIPILAFISYLYVWAVHPSIHVNAVYLNTQFFAIRTLVYFAIWVALAWRLRRLSLLRDNESYSGKGPETFSGLGLVLLVLTVSLSSVDWIMSLEPDWYSTIFGVLVMVAQGLAALSIGVVVLNTAAAGNSVPGEAYHDLGNLLLLFILLWGYMAFSQYLVVWSGNLPEETAWYLHRRVGGWPWIASALILFHFAIPFFLLLFRSVKRKRQRLYGVACGILAVHFVDCYWLIMPTFRPDGPTLLWQDVAAMIGIGGIWIAAMVRGLDGAPFFARGSISAASCAGVPAGDSQ